MKASFFEPIRYVTSQELPAQWPLAPGFYDPEVGGALFQSIIERLLLVEALGFDWVSFSEHHYGGRILTPSPILMASHMAAHLHKVNIAVLGPIMALNNPVRVAEEFAMLDNLTQGRLVVGMLRGTTNEYLVYDVNPEEAREITTEGMELVLKAWSEPQPFGWQGRHFQFRSVSVWPRPWQQPFPPTFALGTSRESCDFAARHHLGLGVSFGPVDAMSRVTQYYREQCARYDWQPTSDQIIYRGHILLAETDAEAQEALQRRQELGEVTFPMRRGVRDALGRLDSRNIAGVPRPVFRDGPLPTTFVGSPETVVKQIQQFHDEAGVGVVDLSFQGTSAETPQEVLSAIQLFGKEVLPRLHEIDG